MWTFFPLLSFPSPPNAASLSTQVNRWDLLRELYKAARDRNVPSGGPRHPRPNNTFDRGVITDATNSSITISGKNWDDTFTNPWSKTNPTNPSPPSTWKIVVEDCDPRKVLVLNIDEIFTDSVVLVEELDEMVARRIVPSIASLVGKTAFIIKGTGRWWSQRIMQWPNSTVYLLGGIASGGTTQITATTGGWSVNQWAGYDVVYQDGSGNTDRGRITSNSADTLLFTAQRGISPVSQFVIVAADGLYDFSRTPDYAFTWYRGLTQGFYSHYPNDADPTAGGTAQPLSTTQKPVLLGSYSHFNGLFCEDTDFNAFDEDFFSLDDETCSEPNDPKNPDIWKSLRMLQVFIESLAESGNWIDPTKSYDGLTLRPSPFCAATLFAAAGINAQQSRTGTAIASVGIHVSLTMPAGFGGTDNSVALHYAIIDDDGEADVVLAHGSAQWQQGVLLGASFADTDSDGNYLYTNKKIIVSLGWSRWVPREFKYFYDKTCFVPDIDPGSGLYVDPPTAAYPGSWVTRPKSSYYIDHSALGFVQDSTLARDRINGGGGSLGDGVFARFVGDNWNDPGIYSGGWFAAGSDPAAVQVYNRFFCGRHAPAVQLTLDGQLSGTASSGDRFTLNDTAKDWWSTYWYQGGTLHSETGTASGGSTTTLIDVAQAGSGFWGDGRFIGFVLEVTISGTVHKRVITGHTGTTLSWSEPLVATAAGKAYRIRLPKYELNRFKGRTLRVVFADLTVNERVIVASDDQSLFVASAFDQAITATSSYEIKDAVLGGIYKVSGGAFVPATGLDPRSSRIGDGHAVSFRDDLRANMPDMVKRYGRMMMGDYVVIPFLMEMYDCFNWLQWTIGDCSWSSRIDPAVAENNQKAVDSHLTSFFNGANWKSTIRDPADAAWATNTNVSPAAVFGPAESDATAPYAYSFVEMRQTDPPGPVGDRSGAADLLRQWAYAVFTVGDGDTCPVASTTDFYIKTRAPNQNMVLLAGEDTCGDDASDGTTEEHISFDPNGDTVACHVFRLFSSSNTNYPDGEGNTNRRSGRLGSLDEPHWPPSPEDPPSRAPYAFRATTGWVTDSQFQITKWIFDQAIDPSELEYGVPRPALDENWWWWWLR